MKVPLAAGFATALSCLALVSCSIVSDPTVRLLTNRPELAAYVERYNAAQEDVRVEITYAESPSQSVLSGVQTDAAVGEWLAVPQLLDKFESTADIVKMGRIDPSLFYAGLLAMGSKDNRPVLIPVSFDLPAVVFSASGSPPDLPSLLLPLDLLRSYSRDFNRDDASAIGFSPLWDSEFLETAAALFGTQLKAGRLGSPAWDAEGLSQTAGFLRDWTDRVNGGSARDAAFAEKFFVQPYYKLIEARRIRFASVSFTEFLSLPEEKRKDMDYRWPSSGGVVPVREDVLFAGVLRSARNKRGAKNFLEWFFSLQNQKSFLDDVQSLRIGVFGITDGFSSIKSLNEVEMTRKYPILLGHMPSESMLKFPETLPNNWLRIRKEVLWPWLIRSVKGTETGTFSSILDTWQKETQ